MKRPAIFKTLAHAVGALNLVPIPVASLRLNAVIPNEVERKCRANERSHHQGGEHKLFIDKSASHFELQPQLQKRQHTVL